MDGSEPSPDLTKRLAVRYFSVTSLSTNSE
jgi:hypothetical protein